MLCLIVFCSQLHTFAFSCFYAGSCRCHFRVLSDFLCALFAFCCFSSPVIVFTLLHAFSFALLQLFLMCFLTGFVLTFFALKISGLHNFLLARFRFFWRRCLFFRILLTYMHLYRTARPLVCQDSLPVSSLTPSTILANYVMFCCPCSHLKNMPWSPIFASLPLVFLFPRANTSYCPPANPFAPIRSRLRSFWSCLTEHDVRGNFPGHRPQIRACETIISSPLPCFCVPRAPYTPTHA